jgi:hypothetical protein
MSILWLELLICSGCLHNKDKRKTIIEFLKRIHMPLLKQIFIFLGKGSAVVYEKWPDYTRTYQAKRFYHLNLVALINESLFQSTGCIKSVGRLKCTRQSVTTNLHAAHDSVKLKYTVVLATR